LLWSGRIPCRDPGELYDLDTDNAGREVHHEEKFGPSAFPEDKRGGTYMCFLSQNNAIFREAGHEPKQAFPDDRPLRLF
jgi:hypothetical protein